MFAKIALVVLLAHLVVSQSEEDIMKMMEGEGEKEAQKHYAGDKDGCESKEEAMMKKFSFFKKMEEMQKYKEAKEKKMEMEKKLEMYGKFKMFMEMAEKKNQMQEMEMKKRVYEQMQQQEAMQKKVEEEKQFSQMIESFAEQKEKFVFQLTKQFLTLCQCGEVSAQMSKMFMDFRPSNMSAEVAEESVMEAMASGDMAGAAREIKKMSAEQQKKLYISGLVKTMCGGAKSFVLEARKFEETYMMSNGNQTSMGAPPTTANPFQSP